MAIRPIKSVTQRNKAAKAQSGIEPPKRQSAKKYGSIVGANGNTPNKQHNAEKQGGRGAKGQLSISMDVAICSRMALASGEQQNAQRKETKQQRRRGSTVGANGNTPNEHRNAEKQINTFVM